MDFRLVPNQSEKGKYNLIWGWFNKISLCVGVPSEASLTTSADGTSALECESFKRLPSFLRFNSTCFFLFCQQTNSVGKVGEKTFGLGVKFYIYISGSVDI